VRQLRLVVVAALAVACLGAAGSALASDASVRSAIEKSSREVKESGALKQALVELIEEPKTLEKDHKAIGKFDVTLGKVIAKVSAQPASTANGKKGKQEFIGGLRKLITGFSDLDKAITDALKHEKAGAKAELKKAASTVKAAAAETKRGELLLHVKGA
jgi:hypothetical protein